FTVCTLNFDTVWAPAVVPVTAASASAATVAAMSFRMDVPPGPPWALDRMPPRSLFQKRGAGAFAPAPVSFGVCLTSALNDRERRHPDAVRRPRCGRRCDDVRANGSQRHPCGNNPAHLSRLLPGDRFGGRCGAILSALGDAVCEPGTPGEGRPETKYSRSIGE